MGLTSVIPSRSSGTHLPTESLNSTFQASSQIRALDLGERGREQANEMRSIVGRMFSGVDHDNFNWPSRRFQLEAKLFLERREDRRTVQRGVGAGGIRATHLIWSQRQIDVETAAQTGAIKNHTLEQW